MRSLQTKANIVLTMSTIAFTICFAVWMMNGVLITYLVDNGLYNWDKAQIGWLIGVPVLTGAIVRLPVGILTDKYGGRIVFTILMIVASVATYFMSSANSFSEFIIAGLGFGISGASFAVGIAYTSVWFPKEKQGTALGIFGAGNAGAAITSMGAPVLLKYLTNSGTDLDAWRLMPKVYALILLMMAIIFYITTYTKVVKGSATKTLSQRLAPLKEIRVWRFGLYYFLVFGGFVALAQWLIPYYVNVYTMSVAMAGMMAAIFSLPSGVIRAVGGWMSDKYGARLVMYVVLGSIIFSAALVIIPRMEIQSPGEGIMAKKPGVVTTVTDSTITVDDMVYTFKNKSKANLVDAEPNILVFPKNSFWQEPTVEVGEIVSKKQLLARGITHIFFQANVWIFTFFVFIIGIMMGIGKAAVYKFIPEYFPDDVGVVGGIVGVVGGLGGFISPVIFGYLLKVTGLWTTTWMFFFVLSVVCLIWLHIVARKMMKSRAPELLADLEEKIASKSVNIL
ncbi:MAG: NarK/NasA family nitrate transporter [Candidatus Marinimicrobia bacterium]|jgi:MFS transporter, NNP family, nitrate/nitrite transporter|nr:NarK/NasA family nitrate transporter [Candidatus Neomarinimicrobiota bacterium]MBT3937832.1 NarK/NasA family nitrate transporter [Candidatus Neomarinimicrobiota bacterium]MBT3960792.1 NarK/NasA family nitrate transporter [Candidatus Neomarinimicrobiota bacterium]MBT4383189.1 NarK/NasA family nitrate transporter [Candidatus Neomarinimicrobiota bacterium]MBT4636018.1 NarK/NasA family nitrate transporter [Candidatus Neomarinimicrobiota bacterium]